MDSSGATTDSTGTAGTSGTAGSTGTETESMGADDTASTDAGGTDATGTGSTATGTTGTDSAATSGTGSSMDAGQAMNGTVTTLDGTGKTFAMDMGGQTYNVTVNDQTEFGGTSTSAEQFFGSDRAKASVSVEGDMTGQNIVARRITLQ